MKSESITRIDSMSMYHLELMHDRDYLNLRVRYPMEEKIYEAFDKGRLFDLQYHTYKEGVSRELCFFNGSRVDGLVRREVIVSKKVFQRYCFAD
jgi:hypothetical protein